MLYSGLGGRLMTIYDGKGKRGDNSVKLSTELLQTGLYYVRLTAGEATASLPVMVLK